MKSLFEIGPIVSGLMRNKLGPALVATQVALSLAILCNALYIVNLRMDAASRPSGVSQESEVFRLRISNQKLGGHADQIALQKQNAATIRAVPGVVSVARTNSFPLSQSGSTSGVTRDGKSGGTSIMSGMYLSPDSLVKTWGLKLIEGRDFEMADYLELDQNTTKEYPEAVIISAQLAGKLFPGETNVVGKNFYQGSGEGANRLRIVGLVERLQTANAPASLNSENATILPVRLSNDPYSGYAIRAEPGQRDRVMRDVEQALRQASATPINIQMRTMDEFRTDRYRSEKGLAWMLLAVSSLLIVITASGIVGMSTLWVAQRRKQIGVRRALGARRIDIVRYFLTENWLITTTGIVLGSLLALALNQLLMQQFELPKIEAKYLMGAPLIFWSLGFAAVFAPAWRAAQISPATATRGV